MSRAPDRSYSFDDNDEQSLSAPQQGQHYPQRYQDSPPRDTQASSAPRYAAYVPEHQSYQPSDQYAYQQQSYAPSQQAYQQSSFPGKTTYQGRGPPFAEPRNEPRDPRDLGYTTSMRTASTTTPGMDNLGAAAAGGGIAGIAYGVANTNARESAALDLDSPPSRPESNHSDPFVSERNIIGTDTPYIPEPPHNSETYSYSDSYSRAVPPGAAAASATHLSSRPDDGDGGMHMADYPPNAYRGPSNTVSDNPYQRYSSAWDPRVGQADIYPEDIEDDGDDGITRHPSPQRRSMLGFGGSSSQSLPKVAAVGGTAAAGGVLGALGGTVGRAPGLTPSGNYAPVSAQAFESGGAEKSEWLKSETTGRRKLRWIVGIIIAVIIACGIAGGVVAGIKASQNKASSKPPPADDTKGDLDANSAEIKALLGNSNLHRVFPGVDYTPFNAQYPACLTNPPSQNNVTRDMAVLSQLTKTVRLYGTDCNQTEMVLHSINKLGLHDTKVWLGVWLDNNATTNARGMAAMYDILDKNGDGPFEGVIVGNEVLFRKDMTTTELSNVIAGVKSNFTSKGLKLPIAVSDLGDVWTAELIQNVDVVMSNIHPFFAGVTAAEGAGWTWDFWQSHDVILTQGTNKKNIISETGWPSAGGNDCGAGKCTSTTDGSIAGIDEMNTFMDSFVCQALTNGTNYFWFEAFDEPWKIKFNTPGMEWEDKWGLMDPGRTLKSGLKVPDCGGKTV